ncbi:MAG: AAA family ATPase [Thermoanaerobaculia bacterium]
MIESLSIRNFKVLREVDLELKPLTVIVGPNASGKSSILQAISLCTSTQTIPSRDELNLLRSRTSQKEPSITARIDGADIAIPLELNSSSVSVNRFIALTSDADGPDDPGMKRWKSVLLDLDPRKLATPSYPKDVSLSLPSDGEGLSSILAGLQLERPERFSQIVESLRTVVPNLRGVRIGRVLLKPETVGHEILFDMLGAEGIPARSASHGTLLTLGVLTALSLNDGPQVVLIDDLERGLHPKAMSNFVQQLRGIQNPNLQIVATSHSPYLIDCVEADEVLLTSLDEDGYAIVRPLTDHPDYAEWKGFMEAGEFWSSVGEDWITREKKATA